MKENLSEFFEELAIWEGHLSKVFSDSGFLLFLILCDVGECMLKVD